jgi:hypothetical protein
MIPIPDDIHKQFESLANRLSPENLACDGEISRAQTHARYRQIMREWAVLERKVGRKVTQDEIEHAMMQRWRSGMNREAVARELVAVAKEVFSAVLMEDLVELPRMSLSQIANLVYEDWRSVNYAAKPYLEAMQTLQSIKDNYIMDSGSSIVAYFLSNATSWRGEVAKAVKKELNRRLKTA